MTLGKSEGKLDRLATTMLLAYIAPRCDEEVVNVQTSNRVDG